MRSEDRKLATAVAEKILIWIVGLTDYNTAEINDVKKEWRGLLLPPPEKEEFDTMWKEIEDARHKIARKRTKQT